MPPETIPYNSEIEAALLGAVLTTNDTYYLVCDMVKDESFFLLRHRYIWQAIERIAERHERFDYLTVTEELRTMGFLGEVGGQAYLLHIIADTPTSVHASAYAAGVRSLWARRRLLMASDTVRELATDQELPLTAIIERTEQVIFDITRDTVERTEISIGDALNEVYDDIGAKLEGHKTFFPTGFKALDEAIGGLERGTLNIVAGRPGMGKSSLCTAIGLNAARLGVRAYYISTEMPQQRLAYRVAAMETGINLSSLKHAELSPNDLSLMIEATARLARIPLTLDYVPAASPSQIRARTARIIRESGLDVLIIDGLWQMTAPGKYDRDRILQLGYISRTLVDMAKEFNIPLVLVHQLNRKPEERADHRPLMSDLEYSGQLEQNADVILMLYRDEVYNPATEMPGAADVIITKNRDGRTGVVTLFFEKNTARFSDAIRTTIDLRTPPIEISSRDREVYQ